METKRYSLSHPQGLRKWKPTLDIYICGNHLVIEAELPGIQADDVQLLLRGGDVVIEGERKSSADTDRESYYWRERPDGSFHRCISIPFSIKAEKVDARLHDGVLTIQIPGDTDQYVGKFLSFEGDPVCEVSF